MATLAPAKKNGRAIGSRTLRNVLNALARYERLRSRSSGGVAARPVAVSTTTGKKATRNATVTCGISPWPRISSNTGATAIFGTDWARTIRGQSARLSTGEQTIRTASGTPASMDGAKPPRVAEGVTHAGSRDRGRTTQP